MLSRRAPHGPDRARSAGVVRSSNRRLAARSAPNCSSAPARSASATGAAPPSDPGRSPAGWDGRGRDHSIAERPDQLRVGQVLGHLEHGPLPRPLGQRHERRRNAGHRLAHGARRGAKYRNGIALAEGTEDGGGIGPGIGDGGRGGTRKFRHRDLTWHGGGRTGPNLVPKAPCPRRHPCQPQPQPPPVPSRTTSWPCAGPAGIWTRSPSCTRPDRQYRARRQRHDAGGRQTGIEAVRQKNEWWLANNEVHAVEVNGPFIAEHQFAVQYDFDATSRQTGRRIRMSEMALYTVQDGKIVREQFFYRPPDA